MVLARRGAKEAILKSQQPFLDVLADETAKS